MINSVENLQVVSRSWLSHMPQLKNFSTQFCRQVKTVVITAKFRTSGHTGKKYIHRKYDSSQSHDLKTIEMA
jgi:hypothetical protein